MSDLDNYREEINNIDSELVQLLEKRLGLASKIAKYKLINNLPIQNTAREQELLESDLSYVKDKEKTGYIKTVLKTVIEQNVSSGASSCHQKS